MRAHLLNILMILLIGPFAYFVWKSPVSAGLPSEGAP